ncbi:MAG: hypothetical protein F6J87_28875 [Spirulina sp. SIO3F2]|nr:hypothetical protein [Spirulina sp. SIO3F2]
MSREFWQNYNLRLEPWGIEFAAPIRWDADATSPEAIELSVEQTEWVACEPRLKAPTPRSLYFIDGRRRLDARFLGRQPENNEPIYGAFATIAVGAVQVDRAQNQARYEHLKIERTIAIANLQQPPITEVPCPLGSSNSLLYTSCSNSAVENTPQAPLNLVQDAMLTAEGQLARQLSDQCSTALIIQDGPLRYGPRQTPENALGYVKTMGKQYLPPDKFGLLWDLSVGQRTPIFRIKTQTNKEQWSWYLRSGSPELQPQQLGYHELHGVVRLDMYGSVPLEKVKAMADLSTWLILDYASQPTRDPRAPQNLTPIGALEKELGRRMGDRTLIARRIQQFLNLSAV